MKKAWILFTLCCICLSYSCTTHTPAETAELTTDSLATLPVVQAYGGKILPYEANADETNFVVHLAETTVPLEIDPTFEVAAHNIALLVFEGLNKAQQDKYQGITIILATDSGSITRTVEKPLIVMMLQKRQQAIASAEMIRKAQAPEYFALAEHKIRERYGVDTFQLFLNGILKASGPLMPAYPLGIDTVIVRDTLFANYVYLFRSAQDSTPKLLYKSGYMLQGGDSIFGFSLNPLD